MKKYLALVLGLGVAAIGAAACSGGTTPGGNGTSPTPTQAQTSIHDVQTGVVATNSAVTLNNVIVTATQIGTHNNFWAQDAGGGQYSGIYFYDKSNTVDPSIAVGDTVNVSGSVQNFYGDLEVNVTSFTKVSSGATPTVDTVPIGSLDDSANSRPWLGCLVNVTGANVTTVGLGFGDFGIGSSFGTPQYPIHVGGLMYSAFEQAYVGEQVTSLTGVVDFNYDWTVLPRSAADITLSGTNTVKPYASIALAKADALAATPVIPSGQLVQISGPIYVTGTSGKLNTKTNAYTLNFWGQDGTTGATNSGIYFVDSFHAAPAVAPGSKLTNSTNNLYGKLIQMTSGNKLQGWELEFGFADHPFNSSISSGSTITPFSITLANFATTAPAYEGQLVKVTGSGMKVQDVANPTYHNEYSVGSSTTTKFWVGSIINDTSAKAATMSAGSGITSITGPLYNAHYLYLEPRSANDLQ